MNKKFLALGRGSSAVVTLLIAVLLCWWRLPIEAEQVRDHLRGFPESDAFLHGLRPYVMAGIFFLPFLGTLLYAFSGILSRWLVREYLRALLVCYGGILLIYFLIDFSGNAARLGEKGTLVQSTWFYYSRMAPAIMSQMLPFGILFSVMYCMTKISRSREVVAALQSGRSMFRVMLPIYLSGLLATLFHLGCNYQWAPMAEGMKGAHMDEARGRTGTLMNHAVYYDAKGRRMWMVTEIPRGFDRGVPMKGVEVTSLNEDGSLASRLYAQQAVWNENERGWKFYDVQLTDHHKNQYPVFVSPPNPYTKNNWTETPAQIVQLGLNVRYLGIPELSGAMNLEFRNQWLEQEAARYQTQWHYRLALPLSCLVYVSFSLPLSLYVTRRAHGGTIALAIIITIQMVLLTSVALALGESGNLSPSIAAWSPILLFSALGVWMMHRRSSGRALWS